MTIKEYKNINETKVLNLYSSVGWTAYTDDPASLFSGFAKSLLILAAYEGESLAGLVRCVGDGETIIYVQDILVYPEFQRRGIGTALLREVIERFAHVRQLVLSTDSEERTLAFYSSMGFAPLDNIGCRGFTLIK